MPKNGQNKAFFEHFLWVKLWVTKRSSLRGVEYSEGPKLSKMSKMTLNLHVEQKIIITRQLVLLKITFENMSKTTIFKGSSTLSRGLSQHEGVKMAKNKSKNTSKIMKNA